MKNDFNAVLLADLVDVRLANALENAGLLFVKDLEPIDRLIRIHNIGKTQIENLKKAVALLSNGVPTEQIRHEIFHVVEEVAAFTLIVYKHCGTTSITTWDDLESARNHIKNVDGHNYRILEKSKTIEEGIVEKGTWYVLRYDYSRWLIHCGPFDTQQDSEDRAISLNQIRGSFRAAKIVILNRLLHKYKEIK